MNAVEKRNLSKEAEMQLLALKKINRWKVMSLAISVVGIGVMYAGFFGAEQNLFLGIFGVAIVTISVVFAVVLNLGLKNGRRNVEKILNALVQ